MSSGHVTNARRISVNKSASVSGSISDDGSVGLSETSCESISEVLVILSLYCQIRFSQIGLGWVVGWVVDLVRVAVITDRTNVEN